MSAIDDAALKVLVREYGESGSPEKMEKIHEILAVTILEYPRRIFFRNADDCSDYYEYVCHRLASLLKGFRETGARFMTWFLVVLRNLYLNWLKSAGAEKTVKPCVLSRDPVREGGLSDFLRFREWTEKERRDSGKTNNPRHTLFKRWFEAQKPERRLLMCLLYADCDPAELLSLTGNPDSAAEFHREYLEVTRRSSQKRERVLNRLAACQADLLRLERSLAWTGRVILDPGERKSRLDALRSRLDLCRARLAKWRLKLDRMKFNMPYGWVSRLTGWRRDRIKQQLVIVRRDLAKALGLEEGK